MKDIFTIILAAGKGNRMPGREPKVLREIAGQPIIVWGLDLLKEVGISNILLVSGYGSKKVASVVNNYGYDVKFYVLDKLLGTAYSAKKALTQVPPDVKDIMVMFGDDMALYRKNTIKKMLKYYYSRGKPATLLTSILPLPTPIGGLEKDEKGNVVGVLTKGEMEKRGITEHEILCGAFCFDRKWIEEIVKQIPRNKFSGEYPLPGLIKIARSRSDIITTFSIEDPREWNSVNTEEELKEADEKKCSLLKK